MLLGRKGIPIWTPVNQPKRWVWFNATLELDPNQFQWNNPDRNSRRSCSTTNPGYHILLDMSDKRDDPTRWQLEDGTLRCLEHYLEHCGKCGVDYTFMREILEEEKAGEGSDYSSDGALIPVQGVKWNKCIICREPAKKTCSRCKDVHYCSAKHQELDREAHKEQCTKTKAGQKVNKSSLPCLLTRPFRSSKPAVLLISVGGTHELIDQMNDKFFKTIQDKVVVLRAAIVENAIHTLTTSVPPASVIVGDSVHPKEQSALVDALIHYAKNGGTVVLGLGFSSSARPRETDEIFSRFGLPWKTGPYGPRLQFVLHPDEPAAKDRKPDGGSNRKRVRDKRPKEELLERSINPLPYAYDMKSLRIKDVPSDQAIYLEHGVEPPDKDQLLETPVAFAPIGQGWVGYIGDTNHEGMTKFVLRAMIGLRVPLNIPSPVPSEDRFLVFS